MSTLLTLALAYAAFRFLPGVLAEFVATLIGIRLVVSNHGARKRLLAPTATSVITASTWDRRPTRAERRALQHALHAALDLTTFTSLLPHVAVRSYKIVNFIGRA
ncbi:hypothetical protein [Sphingomonas sp. Leaf25]|uniref:hypothetical protein n=1 Tax=Sphingomonas sp. Leaf25 TaxID=1735692 RepID=UPI0006FCAF88|nr:hypothetical protein [Sphingomonas sp. Leaf25]KQN01452.1 hypothetical protein ASE78_17395 [Sphingomonas sp. Leaf25]